MAVIGCAALCFLAVVPVTSATQWIKDNVTNVALHKNIVLSNVSENESRLAVDGNTDQNIANGSCITIETNGDVWWQVDLDDVYTIFNILVIPTENFHETTAKKEEHCYQKLLSYRGQASKTRSGRTCQRWESQSPHKHNYKPEYFGNNFLTDNYCRAMVHQVIPWCFTIDPLVRQEACDIHIEECDNVLNTDLNLMTGALEKNLVNIDFLKINDDLHHTWELVLLVPARARFVKFHQNVGGGYFQLCEVEVYGTKEAVANVALKKTAEMSTQYVDRGSVLSANLAVDGIKNQNFFSGSCFHTSNERPWWRVDLGDIYMILMMRIYNRLECCSDRAHDLILLLWVTPEEIFKLDIVGRIRDIHNIYIGTAARFLELQHSENEYLHLCEVEVYGKPAKCQSNPCKNSGNCFIKYCDGSNKCRDYTCICQTGYAGDHCEISVENVAIGKDIIASSITYASWLPSNIIDGDTNQNVGNGATCVSTQKEAKPYLIIDLGAEYTISGVKTYKPLDCCHDDISDLQLLFMLKTWTSYEHAFDSTELVSTIELNPFVTSRLVRLQAKGTQPASLKLCEIEVFAVCQEEAAIKDESIPFMQMRFSLSDEYESEDSFIYWIRQELSNYTGYSVDSFQNVQLEKDPFRVSFELHSTDGKLRTLRAMLEKIEKLFQQGFSEMKAEDGQKLTIIPRSLQYHLIYLDLGNTGSMLNGALLRIVYMVIISIMYM